MEPELKKELENEIRKTIRDLYPEEIDGEVGVGKFRMTIHRIYEAGDGWLTGGKAYYAIIEVMNRVVKISRHTNWDKGAWMIHFESGGAGRMSKNDLFSHKIKAFEHAQALRKSGDLYSSFN